MEFDILGVNLNDVSLNEDEVRNGNAQDPGKMQQNCCLKNCFCAATLHNLKCKCLLLYIFFPDYRYKKDELFKRLKVTTFAQLVSKE